ncbi:MAG: hypothetical protein IPN48_16320 [Sphingomonadales bacterium]|nr:hypothetical protein [Sphingomonadales bacterium]
MRNGLELWRRAVDHAGDPGGALFPIIPSPIAKWIVRLMLAAGLVARGFEKGDRIACYVRQNIPQFVTTLIAAWKAGGISSPSIR